jgi:hypothetical protein
MLLRLSTEERRILMRCVIRVPGAGSASWPSPLQMVCRQFGDPKQTGCFLSGLSLVESSFSFLAR